jgi:hypothetical protein
MLRGVIAAPPEPLDTTPPSCFVFIDTGESIPQEVLVSGPAAHEAAYLEVGERVDLDLQIFRGVWRAEGLRSAGEPQLFAAPLARPATTAPVTSYRGELS